MQSSTWNECLWGEHILEVFELLLFYFHFDILFRWINFIDENDKSEAQLKQLLNIFLMWSRSQPMNTWARIETGDQLECVVAMLCYCLSLSASLSVHSFAFRIKTKI